MSADGAQRLFAYGTLMVDAVREAVCGRHLAARAAELAGYARYALVGEVYPAIVPQADAVTTGVIVDGVDDALWHRLDEWESPLYQRVTVDARTANGEQVAASAYVLAPAHRHRLTREAWSSEEFSRVHLAAYVARWVHEP